MKKRLLSILLMCCMVLTLLPTTAFATGGAEEPPVCTCETACTAESMNAGCAVCGAAGASVESCAKYAAPVNGQDNKPYSTQSFLAENLVDPMIRIHLSPDGGYYAIEMVHGRRQISSSRARRQRERKSLRSRRLLLPPFRSV